MKRRRWIRDSALGLGLFAALFACTEGVLRLAGWGAPRADSGLSRGFDRRASYLVQDPNDASAWVTQFGDRKYPEQHIPAKGSATRVILFGGSNTFHFPDELLEETLNGSDGARYEVINLGRRGYGSERVSVILEQAVRLLEPDVVVIYSGHNEFVERGFKIDLDEQWESPLARGLGLLLERSHTVALVADSLRPDTAYANSKPEAWKSEYSKFRDLPYEQTLRYYGAYEQNLVEMIDTARAGGARVLLSTVIHNRLAAPFSSPLKADWDAAQRANFEDLRARIEQALPESLAPVLASVERDRVHHMDWLAPKRRGAPSERRGALPGLRPSTGPLADQDPKYGVFWQQYDKVWRLYDALGKLWARDFDDEERAQLELARTLLEEARVLHPRHALTLFESGVVLYATGADGAEVTELFEAAARLDTAPRKGNGATNARVRAAAAARPGVQLFDADALFASRVPLGLVGWEWMWDHCHLNVGAGEVLMEDLAEALRAMFER